MERNNIDLLSKLRQRLIFTNMWAQQQQKLATTIDPKMPINHQEKILTDFLENNNQLTMMDNQRALGRLAKALKECLDSFRSHEQQDIQKQLGPIDADLTQKLFE